MSDYGQFEPWLDRLDRLTEAYPDFPTVEIEARVLAAALIACLWHRPTHPSFVRWMERAATLVRSCDHPAACARLAFYWLFCGYWYSDDGAKISEMLEYSVGLRVRLGDAPFEQILTQHGEAAISAIGGDTERALRAMDGVLETSARTGVHLMDVMALGMGVWVCLGAGHLAQADALLQRMQERLDRVGGSKLDRVLYGQVCSFRAAASGDVPTAQRHLALTMQLKEELKVIPGITNALLTAAHYHVERGELDAARAALGGAAGHCRRGLALADQDLHLGPLRRRDRRPTAAIRREGAAPPPRSAHGPHQPRRARGERAAFERHAQM